MKVASSFGMNDSANMESPLIFIWPVKQCGEGKPADTEMKRYKVGTFLRCAAVATFADLLFIIILHSLIIVYHPPSPQCAIFRNTAVLGARGAARRTCL